jgi:hypothetical protein
MSASEKGPTLPERPGWAPFGYSLYNPVVIQRLLNIYRVFYNYAKKGDDKKTPAMRLGLAAGPVDIGRIISFRPD